MATDPKVKPEEPLTADEPSPPPPPPPPPAGVCYVNGQKDPEITTEEACVEAGGRWVPNNN
jgi:hypothetical protein